MNRLLTLVFVWLMVACAPTKKSVKAPDAPVAAVVLPADTVVVVPDTVAPASPATLEVTIGLLLPLQLKRHMEEDTLPDTQPLLLPEAVPPLHFYEGALLAADSLARLGCRVQFKVVDTGTDSLLTIASLNSISLPEVDAVVSLLPAGYNKAVAAASNRWKKSVYVFSASNTQLLEQHPYLYLLSPSNHTQIRMMGAFLAQSSPSASFIAVYREQRKEEEIARLFITSLDSASGKTGSAILYNWKGGWSGLKSKLVKGKKNVLILPTSDESFLSSLLNKLQEEEGGYTFQLCGLPAWENFESLDPLVMQSFEATFFNGSYIDYKSPEVIAFRRWFIAEYHADPLPQAFWGYDLVPLIAGRVNALQQVVSLPPLPAIVEVNKSPHWKMVCEGCGYENRNLNILRFGVFELIRVN